MDIVVIGKAGQVSRSLVDVFSETHHNVTALGRPQIDVSKPGLLNEALRDYRADIVINTAAYTDVEAAEDNPVSAYEINAKGAEHVALAAKRMGVPLIHFSTDYVFNGQAIKPYSEESEPSPLGVYGTSKLYGDLAVERSLRRHLILRTTWVYSAYGKNFVKTMLRLALSRDVISVVEDQIGNPTYSHDIACALNRIIDHLEAKGDSQKSIWGLYNLTGSGNASWADLAEEVFSVSRSLSGPTAQVVRIKSNQRPSNVSRPQYSVLDTQKIAHVFGVELPNWRVSLKQCVSQLLNGDLKE